MTLPVQIGYDPPLTIITYSNKVQKQTDSAPCKFATTTSRPCVWTKKRPGWLYVPGPSTPACPTAYIFLSPFLLCAECKPKLRGPSCTSVSDCCLHFLALVPTPCPAA